MNSCTFIELCGLDGNESFPFVPASEQRKCPESLLRIYLGGRFQRCGHFVFQSFPVYWYFESSSDLSNSKPHVWDKNTQIWMLNQESCSCFMYVFSFEMFECIYCAGRDRVALCSALYGTCRCRADSPTELWSSCLLSVKLFWGRPFCDKWEENQEGQQQSS